MLQNQQHGQPLWTLHMCILKIKSMMNIILSEVKYGGGRIILVGADEL